MVNKARVINEFIELVTIDSISLQERNMADILKSKINGLGLEPLEDDAGKACGGQAGNIFAVLTGDPARPKLLLSAHMDTVSPGKNKHAVIQGDKILSDGTAVLGADDAGGIVSILEALRVVINSDLPHGEIKILFTVAEEIGLKGSKNVLPDLIKADYGIVMDGEGPAGIVINKAPAKNRMDIVIHGVGAHAGVEPEKGVDAVKILARAVSNMKLGRIDEATTANIGIVSGGKATNIVCDRIEIAAEARSTDMEKLKAQTDHMRACFEEAADFLGGNVGFKSELEYNAVNIENEEMLIQKLANLSGDITPLFKHSGGGSDSNIFNGYGIPSVAFSVGAFKVHTKNEFLIVDELVKAINFLVNIIYNI